MLVEKNTTKEKRALSEMDLDDEIDTVIWDTPDGEYSTTILIYSPSRAK